LSKKAPLRGAFFTMNIKHLTASSDSIATRLKKIYTRWFS
jgi:hypothetical protein